MADKGYTFKIVLESYRSTLTPQEKKQISRAIKRNIFRGKIINNNTNEELKFNSPGSFLSSIEKLYRINEMMRV